MRRYRIRSNYNPFIKDIDYVAHTRSTICDNWHEICEGMCLLNHGNGYSSRWADEYLGRHFTWPSDYNILRCERIEYKGLAFAILAGLAALAGLGYLILT